MTATRDARDIAERILEIHRKQKDPNVAGWIGDAICDAFKDTEILAKEHLAQLERCRRLEAVFHAADRVYCIGGVHVDGVVNLEEMFEALSVFRESEAKT